MIDIGIRDTVRFKRLENLMNAEVTINIGYDEGHYADIARYLIEGSRGAKHKGWDFINDGLKSKIDELRLLIREKYKQAKSTGMLDDIGIGEFCVKAVQDFVKGGTYVFKAPNENRYLKRKLNKHAEARPLIISEKFIDALTYKVRSM